MAHIDKASNIHKLERDGFSKETIHKVMYRETAGASQQERTRIIERLYERKE